MGNRKRSKKRKKGVVREDPYDRVYDVAEMSTMIFKHGAVIFSTKTGKIIAEGYNHTANYMSHLWSVHAEVDAISKVPQGLRKQVFKDCVMLVVRISGKDSHSCLSAPCENCRKEIEKAGIKRTFYSVDRERNETIE